MLKKLRNLFLLILVIFGLASCGQIEPTTKYTFKDITNQEINDVSRVLINNGPMTSAQFSFEGDYEKILDVDYVLSDMPYNEIRKIYEEYRFWLHLEFDNTNEGINFYVLNYKLYYFNNETLYESLNKVNYNDFIPKNSSDETKTSNVFVMYDYGMHISGKLTTLLDGNLIWFDPSNYGIDKLVAGDELVIEYTGQFICEESYPGNVAANLMHIQSIEIIEADIVEFTVSAVPGGNELNLVPVDSEYNNYVLSNQGYVVSQDETFKKYDQYPENTILYASLPKTTGSIRVDGLYDYNPREEIVPPENHFLRNLSGCEWMNEITAEDIIKIKIVSGAVGVAPGNLNNISSSTDKDVIARVFEEYYWLDTAPISKMEGQIDGGGSVAVKFILKDGTVKELYINNGNYRAPDGNYFELLFTPKFKDTDNATKAYGFITYIGTGTVYGKDNNPVCEIPMDEFEFVVFSGLDAVITGYYYRVETEFGTLWFDSSNDVFYLRFNEVEVDYREYREYYQLIGKNLDELIAEYNENN